MNRLAICEHSEDGRGIQATTTRKMHDGFIFGCSSFWLGLWRDLGGGREAVVHTGIRHNDAGAILFEAETRGMAPVRSGASPNRQWLVSIHPRTDGCSRGPSLVASWRGGSSKAPLLVCNAHPQA